MLVFLDFDGVLRRQSSIPMAFDPDCLALFESAARAAPEARIVVTSSWRDLETLSEIRARFSPDIAVRILGVVPTVTFAEDFPRYREVLAFLHGRGLAAEPWVAIDDDPRAYPKTAPVILTDPRPRLR